MREADWKWRKIVWAIDGFADEMASQEITAACLRMFQLALPAAIEPVQVASPYRFLPLGSSEAEQDVIRLGTEQHLSKWLCDLILPGMEPPRVIWREDASVRAQVMALLEDAREHGADLIALSTHARHGLDRAFLGSFAETLLLHSEIPVLVVPLIWRAKERIETVLFPYDCTDASDRVFGRAVSLSKRCGARLRVLHKMEDHSEAALTVFRPLPEFQDTQEREAKRRRDLVETLAKSAREEGVGAEGSLVLDKQPIAPYLSALTKSCDVVVMAAQTHNAEALIGSTTRYVVRHSHCPVLVFHPSAG